MSFEYEYQYGIPIPNEVWLMIVEHLNTEQLQRQVAQQQATLTQQQATVAAKEVKEEQINDVIIYTARQLEPYQAKLSEISCMLVTADTQLTQRHVQALRESVAFLNDLITSIVEE